MVRVAVLSSLAFVLFAGVATAAPPDAAKLRAAGVKVSWPVTGTATMAAGQVVEVRVTSRRTRSVVSLSRVDARDRVIRVIARKTLRSGTFRAALPQSRVDARYALRLRVAGRTYSSRVVVPAPVAPPAQAPVSVPVASPAPRLNDCNDSTKPWDGTPAVTFGPTRVRAGERLELRIVNQGPGCLAIPATWHYGFARLSDAGEWEAVPRACDGTSPPSAGPSGCNGLPSFSPLLPGAELDASRPVPSDFAPGQYRVSADLPGVKDLEFEVYD